MSAGCALGIGGDGGGLFVWTSLNEPFLHAGGEVGVAVGRLAEKLSLGENRSSDRRTRSFAAGTAHATTILLSFTYSLPNPTIIGLFHAQHDFDIDWYGRMLLPCIQSAVPNGRLN